MPWQFHLSVSTDLIRILQWPLCAQCNACKNSLVSASSWSRGARADCVMHSCDDTTLVSCMLNSSFPAGDSCEMQDVSIQTVKNTAWNQDSQKHLWIIWRDVHILPSQRWRHGCFFSHENQGAPPSLSDMGDLRQCIKSDLVKCFEKIATAEDWDAPEVDAKILDGYVVVNMLLHKSCSTFGDYAEQVLTLCTEESAKCQTSRCCMGSLHQQQFKAFSNLDTTLLSTARRKYQRTGRVFSMLVKIKLSCITTCPNTSHCYQLKERNCSACKIPL